MNRGSASSVLSGYDVDLVSVSSQQSKLRPVQFSWRYRTKRTGRKKRVKETVSDDKKMENECLQNESGGVSMIWSLDPYSLFLQSGLCNVRFLFGAARYAKHETFTANGWRVDQNGCVSQYARG